MDHMLVAILAVGILGLAVSGLKTYWIWKLQRRLRAVELRPVPPHQPARDGYDVVRRFELIRRR